MIFLLGEQKEGWGLQEPNQGVPLAKQAFAEAWDLRKNCFQKNQFVLRWDAVVERDKREVIHHEGGGHI